MPLCSKISFIFVESLNTIIILNRNFNWLLIRNADMFLAPRAPHQDDLEDSSTTYSIGPFPLGRISKMFPTLFIFYDFIIL